MRWMFALMIVLPPVEGMAQKVPPAAGAASNQDVDAFCLANPRSALCTARLAGAETKGLVDLASYVARGEADGTTVITENEIVACWATWEALRDHVVRKGRGTLPGEYTAPLLAKRAADWDSAVKLLFETTSDAELTKQAKLSRVKVDVASAKITQVAELSGSCKKLPRK